LRVRRRAGFWRCVLLSTDKVVGKVIALLHKWQTPKGMMQGNVGGSDAETKTARPTVGVFMESVPLGGAGRGTNCAVVVR
jgi:hypothetical protein